MKRLFYFVIILLMITVISCSNRGKSGGNANSLEVSETDSTMAMTTVKFNVLEKDMGQVNEGEKVALSYELLNTGKNELLILNVKASCGCTTPEYDKKPVRPGKKGVINVEFNTKGRTGIQHKTVMVTTNTEPPNTTLSFTCEVLSKKQ
jgi:hypothetical protein